MSNLSGYNPDDEIYHQVMGVLAPAMAYFVERPGCADANEAHARANVVMAWLKLDGWAEAHGPTVEEAEPEERSLIRLHAHTVQKGDVVVQGVAAELPWIEVTDVVTRPDDAVEIYGTYNLNEAEKVADRWTVHRMASLTVER